MAAAWLEGRIHAQASHQLAAGEAWAMEEELWKAPLPENTM